MLAITPSTSCDALIEFTQQHFCSTHSAARTRARSVEAVWTRTEQSMEQLQTLRKEMRALKRKRKRLEVTTVWTPMQNVRRLGVLIFRLTNDPKWTIIYVKSWQARNFQRTLCMPGAITDATVLAWNDAFRDDTELHTMMIDLTHAGRMRVDRFLMESMVFEDIVQQSAKDMTVPSSIVLAKYLRTWSLRPRCSAIDDHLEKLRNSAKARRVWGRAFRRRWGLTWGARETNHGIGPAELKRKVFDGMHRACFAYPPGVAHRSFVTVHSAQKKHRPHAELGLCSFI